MNEFFHALGFGIVTASIVGLSSVALTLQWAVSSIPNFAHGELLTVGAYGALVAESVTHNLLIDALIGAIIAGVVALIMYTQIIERFTRARAHAGTIFVVTIGISFTIQNLLGMIFGGGTEEYTLPAQQLLKVGPFLWTPIEIVVMIGSVLIMAALHAFLRYTRYGRSIRAVADNRKLSQACGLDSTRVLSVVWIIAGVIAGLGGVALAISSGSFTTTTGFQFLLVSFAAAVIGGLGRPYGAMVGALIIGVATELSGAYLAAGYKQVFAIGLLLVFLLVRPTGLFRGMQAIGGRG